MHTKPAYSLPSPCLGAVLQFCKSEGNNEDEGLLGARKGATSGLLLLPLQYGSVNSPCFPHGVVYLALWI